MELNLGNKQTIFIIFFIIFILLMVGLGFWFYSSRQNPALLTPLARLQPIQEKTLEKYRFERLKERGGQESTIKLEELLQETEAYKVYLFSFISEGRKITGLAHLPNKTGKLPVVVMMRGYVDQDTYETGMGTRPAGEYYASHGYLTLAPDFLGYGESDMPPGNNLWEDTRFLRLTVALDMLASVASLPQADPEKIFLWGHSNGGMITLAVLELTGGNYPTVLWAPVSRFFPYDVLFYTNEAEDKGKFLRKALAEFEKDYDVDKYSVDEYYGWIKAPVQIEQGTADPYVPIIWTNELVEKLKALGLEVNYYTYPGADHNLRPGWETVVNRDLDFFKSYL